MGVIRDLKDLEDLVVGASILATGGGGSIEQGLALARRVSELGGVELISVDELDGNEIIVSPYFIGSMGSISERNEEKVRSMIERALSFMEKTLGRRVGGIVASEMGGSNTLVAIYAASLARLKVVDGDLMGRAGPELHQSTANIYGIPVVPSVIVTPKGSTIVVHTISDLDFYESVSRHIAYLSGGWSLIVDTPILGSDAKKAIVRGSISRAINIGRALREVRERRGNPVEALVRASEGYVVFKGIVEGHSLRDSGRFLEGYIFIRDEGGLMKIYVKNEYLIAWVNEKPIVMCPDLIILLGENGDPILSNRVREGMKVVVVAARAPEIWRSAAGLELFGPKHFGFDLDYRPVEELVGGL